MQNQQSATKQLEYNHGQQNNEAPNSLQTNSSHTRPNAFNPTAEAKLHGLWFVWPPFPLLPAELAQTSDTQLV